MLKLSHVNRSKLIELSHLIHDIIKIVFNFLLELDEFLPQLPLAWRCAHLHRAKVGIGWHFGGLWFLRFVERYFEMVRVPVGIIMREACGRAHRASILDRGRIAFFLVLRVEDRALKFFCLHVDPVGVLHLLRWDNQILIALINRLRLHLLELLKFIVLKLGIFTIIVVFDGYTFKLLIRWLSRDVLSAREWFLKTHDDNFLGSVMGLLMLLRHLLMLFDCDLLWGGMPVEVGRFMLLYDPIRCLWRLLGIWEVDYVHELLKGLIFDIGHTHTVGLLRSGLILENPVWFQVLSVFRVSVSLRYGRILSVVLQVHLDVLLTVTNVWLPLHFHQVGFSRRDVGPWFYRRRAYAFTCHIPSPNVPRLDIDANGLTNHFVLSIWCGIHRSIVPRAPLRVLPID